MMRMHSRMIVGLAALACFAPDEGGDGGSVVVDGMGSGSSTEPRQYVIVNTGSSYTIMEPPLPEGANVVWGPSLSLDDALAQHDNLTLIADIGTVHEGSGANRPCYVMQNGDFLFVKEGEGEASGYGSGGAVQVAGPMSYTAAGAWINIYRRTHPITPDFGDGSGSGSASAPVTGSGEAPPVNYSR